MRRPKTPVPARSEDHEGYFRDSVTLLRSVRSTLADLLERVLDGESGALKDLAAKQVELESALRRALEAEGRWNEWRARTGEAAAGVEIDFAALREDIACRLARISECCRDE